MSVMTNEWEILLVDDDPDVLSVSKLAMQNFEVYGRPLKLHTASSKAEALELFSKEKMWISTLAVAFIDVVMESNKAGLELCQYIREDLNNSTTQLYIRTGQPGIAPERDIIDRYDINGYFTKAEATEDKLYTLVKSGARQYLSIRQLQGMLKLVDTFIIAGYSQQKLEEELERVLQGFTIDWGKADGTGFYVAIDGQSLMSHAAMDEPMAMALKDKLDSHESTPLGPDGNSYVKDEHNNLLINVVSKPHQPEAFLLFKEMPFAPPDNVVNTLHFGFKSLATIWARAA